MATLSGYVTAFVGLMADRSGVKLSVYYIRTIA